MIDSALLITAMGEERWKPITKVTISTCCSTAAQKTNGGASWQCIGHGREGHLKLLRCDDREFIRKQTP